MMFHRFFYALSRIFACNKNKPGEQKTCGTEEFQKLINDFLNKNCRRLEAMFLTGNITDIDCVCRVSPKKAGELWSLTRINDKWQLVQSVWIETGHGVKLSKVRHWPAPTTVEYQHTVKRPTTTCDPIAQQERRLLAGMSDAALYALQSR